MWLENNRPSAPETTTDHLGAGYPIILPYNSIRSFKYDSNWYGQAVFCVSDITNSYKTLMFYREGYYEENVMVLNAKVQSNKLILTMNTLSCGYDSYKFNSLGTVYTILALA